MSLADIKRKMGRRETVGMVLRGEIDTPVAKAPERKSVPPKQHIRFTPTGPAEVKFPGFLDTKNRPIWGSPEAKAALESAWAAWRLKQGEAVDRS